MAIGERQLLCFLGVYLDETRRSGWNAVKTTVSYLGLTRLLWVGSCALQWELLAWAVLEWLREKVIGLKLTYLFIDSYPIEKARICKQALACFMMKARLQHH